jgi:hypothetical protein
MIVISIYNEAQGKDILENKYITKNMHLCSRMRCPAELDVCSNRADSLVQVASARSEAVFLHKVVVTH